MNNLLEYAHKMDQDDPLGIYRSKFHFPKHSDGQDILYFCGNSLGLQPKEATSDIKEVMDNWKDRAVEGHFTGENAWIDYHEILTPMMAKVVGAHPDEIAIMNTLTVNLHLMMVTFYQPKGRKNKILMDYSPFPSDRYAIYSHLSSRGINPEEAVLELKPQNGEIVTKEDIRKTLAKHGEEITLVLIGGINYYTGQLYPLETIAKEARKYQCKVGFDLAHAAGNVPLNLHELGIDFATWCTYKYLNAGPGNLSGCFVHRQHHTDENLHRYVGWWGFRKDKRFLMQDAFDPEPNASGWILSNPPVIALAGIKTALRIFTHAGIENLREKSVKLTGFLEKLILTMSNSRISIITPSAPEERGCQLSIKVKDADKSLFQALREKGVLGDWREPDVIRITPAPLYNSYYDVYRFKVILEECLHKTDYFHP